MQTNAGGYSSSLLRFATVTRQSVRVLARPQRHRIHPPSGPAEKSASYWDRLPIKTPSSRWAASLAVHTSRRGQHVDRFERIFGKKSSHQYAWIYCELKANMKKLNSLKRVRVGELDEIIILFYFIFIYPRFWLSWLWHVPMWVATTTEQALVAPALGVPYLGDLSLLEAPSPAAPSPGALSLEAPSPEALSPEALSPEVLSLADPTPTTMPPSTPSSTRSSSRTPPLRPISRTTRA